MIFPILTITCLAFVAVCFPTSDNPRDLFKTNEHSLPAGKLIEYDLSIPSRKWKRGSMMSCMRPPNLIQMNPDPIIDPINPPHHGLPLGPFLPPAQIWTDFRTPIMAQGHEFPRGTVPTEAQLPWEAIDNFNYIAFGIETRTWRTPADAEGGISANVQFRVRGNSPLFVNIHVIPAASTPPGTRFQSHSTLSNRIFFYTQDVFSFPIVPSDVPLFDLQVRASWDEGTVWDAIADPRGGP